MVGVLNDTCVWEQKQQTTSKYPETTTSEPLTLPCFKGLDKKLTQTELGLVKEEVQYFLLHTEVVKDGDLLDSEVVAVQPLKDFAGTIQAYKAVVVK